MFPRFSRILPKVDYWVENCGDIPNVPLRNISGASFWFVLSFTDSEHWNLTTGDISRKTVKEPLGEIAGTFFGKIHSVPNNYLIGTLQSHDLVHLESTDHFLHLEHSREISWENSKCSCNVPGRDVAGTLSISLRCTCDVLGRGTTPCPQCEHPQYGEQRNQ